MNKFAIILFPFFVMSAHISCTQFEARPSDNAARADFKKSITMYFDLKYATDHFPVSWENESLRSSMWTASYGPCSKYAHNFYAVFTDALPLKVIDSIEENIHFLHKLSYYYSSVLKIDIDYVGNENSFLQSTFDTIIPPIYDFRNASFLLGAEKDSICVNDRYWCNDKEILPKDLLVYVIDAKNGNFWKDAEAADLEPRPGLPDNWKHGYSRGVAISRSCKRVCWWTMAW